MEEQLGILKVILSYIAGVSAIAIFNLIMNKDRRETYVFLAWAGSLVIRHGMLRGFWAGKYVIEVGLAIGYTR